MEGKTCSDKIVFLVMCNGKILLHNNYDKRYILPKENIYSFDERGKFIDSIEDAASIMLEQYRIYYTEKKISIIKKMDGKPSYTYVKIELQNAKTLNPRCSGWFFPEDIFLPHMKLLNVEKNIIQNLFGLKLSQQVRV